MKKGFSLIMMIGIVFTFLILTTVVIISFSNVNKITEFKKFSAEMFMIQNKIDDYVFRHNGKYPLKEKVTLNITDVEEINRFQFNSCTKEESGLMNFFKIDLKEADIVLNNRGFNETDKDLYVFSLDNKKLYYLKGYEYEGITHYTFNEQMYKATGISKVE